MSRGMILTRGGTRGLALLATATLLASLVAAVGSAVAPARVLANTNCNSAINPIGADGITITFLNTNGNIATVAGQTVTYYDAADGKFYAQPVDGTASATNGMLAFRVTYGGANGSDPWCIFKGDVVPVGPGYNLRDGELLFVDELPASEDETTFTAAFRLADFGVTTDTNFLCLAARVSARQGDTGAPKGSACIQVLAHTTSGEATPTPDPEATPTPTPTGEVLAETTPPTDTGGLVGSSMPALALVLLILALVVGGIGLLTPSSVRIRR